MLSVAPSHLALVALGGGLGAGGRFLASHWTNAMLPAARWPVGTFAVNLIGSILIGAIIMATLDHPGLSRTRLFLITGLLGGFTTFSAFSFELTEMLAERRFGPAAAYAGGSVIICVLGTALGAALVRLAAK
ncbi:MAG: fluoride efflux transporter CrcB [Pseudomonadota bacterium]